MVTPPDETPVNPSNDLAAVLPGPPALTDATTKEFEKISRRYYELTEEEQRARDIADAASRPLLVSKQAPGIFGNKIMKLAASTSAVFVLVTLGAVGAFLVMLAWPALSDSSLALRQMGSPGTVGLWGFTAPQIFGTILASIIALTLALPLSLGVAVAITQYLPRRLGSVLGYLVDLLAAVPSVVFGLWGALVLLPLIQPVQAGANQLLGWLPLFSGQVSPSGRTILAAGVVLAIMVLPVITAVVREIMLQTPADQVEGAIGLGATRWELIRMVVMPHSASGIASASMLGLGRALGETMAVVMVLSVGSSLSWSLVEAGKHSTIAANIALQFPESTGSVTSALVATGLALFAITLVVNTLARLIVDSSSASAKAGRAKKSSARTAAKGSK